MGQCGGFPKSGVPRTNPYLLRTVVIIVCWGSHGYPDFGKPPCESVKVRCVGTLLSLSQI